MTRVPLRFNPDGVPRRLTAMPIWLPWKPVKDSDRTRKVPIDYRTGRPTNHKNPHARLPFGKALEVLNEGHAIGLGISLTPDSNPSLTAVDIDNCVIGSNSDLTPLARAVIARLDSYTELSPSGTGIHIFAIGMKPPGACRRGAIEMYSNQFMTVTGHMLPGLPTDVEERATAIQQLHSELLYRSPHASAPRPHRDTFHRVPSDEEVLAKAFRSRKGNEIRALWFGDISRYNGNHSGADLALINHLSYWTDRNREQVDRLFRRSALYRSKWDERHCSDGRTYGQMTIDRACSIGEEPNG